MTTGGQPPVQPVQAYPVGQAMRPHRGTLILVLGILGLVCCFILGIIAWVMGNGDLREMNMGRMDPSGRGLTQAGKICGMISVILWIVYILGWILIGGLVGISGSMAGGSPV